MTFDPSNLPPRLNLFCIFCCAFPLFVLSLSFSLSQCHLQSFSLRSLSDAVISSIFHKPHVPIFTDHSHLLFNSIKPPQASTPLHLTTQNKNPTEKKAVLKTFCLLLLIVVFPMDESQQPQQTQTQTQTQIQTQAGHDHGGIGGKPAAAAGSSSNYLCRQSSTRWTPTTDQIKILKDLYYNSGVRSPTTDQIQKISARLRQFGKIEGKNVFYWFQNHKARERQKKRFTSANTEIQRPSNIIYPNFTPGISCPSSASGIVGGCGYGHMSMETGLRECEMPACGNGGICSYPTQGFQWTGVNHPYLQSYYSMESTRNQSYDHEDQFPEEDGGKAPGLETLPLFPVHAGSEPVENYYTTSCHWFNAADTVSSGRASLELRLNSYGDQCPNY